MDTKNCISLIDKSKDILLIIPPEPSDDIISSAFAIFRFIKKHRKSISYVSGGDVPQRLSFLKAPDATITSLSGLREFVLVFNTEKNKIIDIKSEQNNNEFVIKVTPEKGSIDPRDFSFLPSDFKHDLIIIIGVPSLESLGELYQSNTDLFFEVPKINIDNKSANENYGQVNVVDLTASSISEICANLFIEHNKKHVDKLIAQALLTGIIAETESFQKPTTTPKAMITAAKLMKYDADQATIIRHLFKTKSFSFLKLWGRVMARLNWDEEQKIAWSLISIEDFVQSRASNSDVPYILEEIQKNFIEGQIFAVIYPESSNATFIQVRFSSSSKAQQFAQIYETETVKNVFRVRVEGKDLLETEKDFLKNIKTLE